jgi:uncharacterized Zn finger protein
MLELAGETYFKRGEPYRRGGHMYDLVEYAGVVVAKVAGTADYRVRLWVEDGLADIMQVLAYRSGAVEAVLAVKSKDLSSPFAYLEIARLYKQLVTT